MENEIILMPFSTGLSGILLFIHTHAIIFRKKKVPKRMYSEQNTQRYTFLNCNYTNANY